MKEDIKENRCFTLLYTANVMKIVSFDIEFFSISFFKFGCEICFGTLKLPIFYENKVKT